MEKQKKSLAEKNIFCFRAVLKHVGKDSTFVVRFNVLAKDKYEAQDILEEWLNEPSRTGYKFDRCVGITQCAEYPSGYIIVDETFDTNVDCRDCTSCAFIEKNHREEPCCSCVDLSNWETKNER